MSEQKDLGREVLSNLIVFSKYSRYDENLKRREVFEEIVERVKKMHQKKFPFLFTEIEYAFDNFVKTKKVLPSMRSLQFAGKPIEVNPTRIYNCSYLPIDSVDAFSEVFFLLLSGCGVGYSIQEHHIEKLPKILKPEKDKFKRYLIGDSIEGWADALKVLLKSYFKGGSNIVFDYSSIRPKGTPLKTSGGIAPGPDDLRKSLEEIRKILDRKENGEQLKPIEVHDILCWVAMAVVSGGIRRSAMISLFDYSDSDMYYCKSEFKVLSYTQKIERYFDESGNECERPVVHQFNGETFYSLILEIEDVGYGVRKIEVPFVSNYEYEKIKNDGRITWYHIHPQRAMANNSVVLVRSKIRKQQFKKIMEIVSKSGSGEPGIFFTNDKDYGTNPCGEISLRPFSFCNLVEVNISDVETQEELNERVRVASFIATLQASYTDFHYLRDVWKKNTEKDALIGVSLTGICSNTYKKLNIEEASKIVVKENERVSSLIGIKPAARKTTIKPSGTASLVLGCSSGIHPYYAKYYIRRVRINKNEEVYKILKNEIPDLLEDDFFNSNNVIVKIPIKVESENASFRYESLKEALDRVSFFFEKWIVPGYHRGPNHNNISLTLYVKEDEWEFLSEWMWNNREKYNGISVLPFDGGTYIQAPLEEISEEKYKELYSKLKNIDFKKVIETKDNTNLKEVVACSGNSCEIS